MCISLSLYIYIYIYRERERANKEGGRRALQALGLRVLPQGGGPEAAGSLCTYGCMYVCMYVYIYIYICIYNPELWCGPL